MAKAKLKTAKTNASVAGFLDSVKDPQQRADSVAVAKLMAEATGEKPRMWGTSIVGFGTVHLKYPSGRELDWMRMGFSPRKAALTLYGLLGSATSPALLKKLGKFTTGKGCLYIKKLADVDLDVLKSLMRAGC